MKQWSVLVIGLLLGLAGGLVYTWALAPLEYYDTYPPLLRPAAREDWIRMTAFAYAVEGDWERTALRLRGLELEEVSGVMQAVLEEAISIGRPIVELQRLAWMAKQYGVENLSVEIYTEGTRPIIAPTVVVTMTSPTVTPTAEVLLLPTVTTEPTPQPEPTLPLISILATPQPSAPYLVLSRTITCTLRPRIAVSLTATRTVSLRGREQVETVGLPAEEVWLLWDDGADRAVTGLRPDMGLGYADFMAEPNRLYKLYIGNPTGVPIITLELTRCTTDRGEASWTTWQLLIQHQMRD